MNELRSKRGSYFIDENPDFDSGFCTLLYAENFIKTSYPIFLSGQSAASNSGAVNTKATYKKGITDFVEDSTSKREEVIWSDLDQISSLEVVIISAMRRFLPEANKVLKGKKIELNKQNIFNLVAKGIGMGHENTTFQAEVEILKKIAKKWKVSTEAIPLHKRPTIGVLFDKGINKSATLHEDNINHLIIDGNQLGINHILDAVKIVESLTTDWFVLLNTLGHTKNKSHPSRESKINCFDLITTELQKGNYKKAEMLLEENILSNPWDATSLMFLGTMFYNQNYLQRPYHLARSLSFKFNIKVFDAYFNSLIKLNQLDSARLVLENYTEELKNISSQLNNHCIGILEMASGNYESAAIIFNKIKPHIDSSLYFYCAAYANFLKGEAANANQLVKKALHLNDNKQEFLELEAKIAAVL